MARIPRTTSSSASVEHLCVHESASNLNASTHKLLKLRITIYILALFSSLGHPQSTSSPTLLFETAYAHPFHGNVTRFPDKQPLDILNRIKRDGDLINTRGKENIEPIENTNDLF
jgi:hypothetical protein